MAAAEFVAQLSELGYEPAVLFEDRTTLVLEFRYTVETGARAGSELKLGFVVPADFPASPPSGPHVSPRILPLRSGGNVPHPYGGIHAAQHPVFDQTWEYWSRPYPGWPATTRTAGAYMAHVRNLFESVP